MPEPPAFSERLTLTRLRRPDPEELGVLAGYDRDAFAGVGLRACDLAVIAEAGAVYVARVGEEIVGGCQVLRLLDEPGYLYIVGFYIRPEWQGRGLGRMFLEALRAACEQLGAEGLVLTVAPDNVEALGLYRDAGFAVENLVPGFYGAGQDRYILRLRFAQEGLHSGV